MIEKILHLIFPPKCIFCNSILHSDSTLEVCKKCYGMIPFARKAAAFKHFPYRLYYDDVICAFEYSGIVRHALVKYKFFNKPTFYRAFAKLLHNSIKNVTDCQNFDIIISIPLHKKRERDRGYNQARLISKALSRETGIPDKSWLLSRIRETGAQSLLGKRQRVQNIKDAFKVNDPKKVVNKSILLVDDIFTTGSTVNECSKVLKEAGASNVVVAVIASGRK